MKTNVLVVGGAGYIGGAVTDTLLAKKIPHSVYDNLLYENHYLKDVDFIYGDVRDRAKLSKLLKKYTHVIWLAAVVGDGACAINPNFTKTINQDSVQWLSKHFDGRILFTSTCSVYGINKEPVSEESLTNPISVYAQTKLEAEKYLKKKNALILRLGTAYGLSDRFSRVRMDLAINYMTMNAIRFGELTVFGGQQWRPFVHVKDIGRILVKNLSVEHTGIYNLATENSNILDIATRIKKTTKCNIKKVKQKFEDERNYYADTTKGLKDKIFSTKTEFTIDHGIKEVSNLVKENRVKNLDLEYYSNEKHLLQEINKYKEFIVKM